MPTLPVVVLTKVEYKPEPETVEQVKAGERDCMPRFRIEGTCNGKRFACRVSFEIDGRDCEYEHVRGPRMECLPGDSVNWDAMIEVLDQDKRFTDKFEELSASYYEGE